MQGTFIPLSSKLLGTPCIKGFPFRRKNRVWKNRNEPRTHLFVSSVSWYQRESFENILRIKLWLYIREGNKDAQRQSNIMTQGLVGSQVNKMQNCIDKCPVLAGIINLIYAGLHISEIE